MAYLCSWEERKAVVNASDRREAKEAFIRYMEGANRIHLSPEEVEVEYVCLITAKRGFVELES